MPPESLSNAEEVFFGVSFGLNTTKEAVTLIDKVKGYTNVFCGELLEHKHQ